jgi:hypothetical protein
VKRLQAQFERDVDEPNRHPPAIGRIGCWHVVTSSGGLLQ